MIKGEVLYDYTPEDVANKRTSFQVTPDDSHYPSEKLVKDSLNGKQSSLGYTPENIANKETSALDTSTTKYPCNNVVKNADDLKVDKVTGKGLSTNDLTDALKSNYDTAYTDAHTHSNKSALDLVSGTNTGDQTLAGLGGVPTSRQVNGKALSDDITLTTADVADSSNKRYCTEAEKTVIGNTSNTNSGNETATSIGTLLHGASAITTPDNTDEMGLWDHLTSLLKKITWANIKATLKAYFDTLYTSIAGVAYYTKTQSFTIDAEPSSFFYINPCTSDQYTQIVGTMPAGASNVGKTYTLMHGTNNGVIKIAAKSGEYIYYNGASLSYIYLYEGDNYLTLTWNSSIGKWHVLAKKIGFFSGWINTNDESLRWFGTVVIPYDNKNAAVDFSGMTLTESTSSNTATIVYDSGGTGTSGNLYCIQVTGTGIFTDNRTLTMVDAHTCLVNVTTSTKNNDTYINHYLTGLDDRHFLTTPLWNTSASMTGSQQLIKGDGAGSDVDCVIRYNDTNSYRILTGASGTPTQNTSGAYTRIYSTEGYYGIQINLI